MHRLSVAAKIIRIVHVESLFHAHFGWSPEVSEASSRRFATTPAMSPGTFIARTTVITRREEEFRGPI